MSNPESPQRKKKLMEAAAARVRNTTPGLKKPKKVQQVVKLNVVDFTIWKGFKFGFGFMMGIAGFSIVVTTLAFLIKMVMLGFFTTLQMPV